MAPVTSSRRLVAITPCHTFTSWVCTAQTGLQLLESDHSKWQVQPWDKRSPLKTQASVWSELIVAIPRLALSETQLAVIGSPIRLMSSTEAWARTLSGPIVIVAKTATVIKDFFISIFLESLGKKKPGNCRLQQRFTESRLRIVPLGFWKFSYTSKKKWPLQRSENVKHEPWEP